MDLGVAHAGDCEADVHGLGTDGLMFSHAGGRQIWQVMADDARGSVIMPVGCPTCVTTIYHLADVPEELRASAVLGKHGDDLLKAVLHL